MKTPMLFLPFLAVPLGADSRISSPDSVWSYPGQWHETFYIAWTPVEGADAYEIHRKRHPSMQDTAWHLVQIEDSPTISQIYDWQEDAYLRAVSVEFYHVRIPSSEWSVAIGVRARQDSLGHVSGLTTARLSSQLMPVDPRLPAPAVRVEEDPTLGHYVLAWPAIDGANEYGVLESEVTYQAICGDSPEICVDGWYREWDIVEKATVKAGLDEPVVRWKTAYPIRYWIDWGWPEWSPRVFWVYAVWTEEEWTSVRTTIEVPTVPTGARRSTWGQVKRNQVGRKP